MKTFRPLLIIFTVMLLFSPLFLQSQAKWIVQHSGLPESQNPTLIFAPVNPEICWGIQFETITDPKVVLTIDGGNTWSTYETLADSGYRAYSISAIDAETAWIVLDHPFGLYNGGVYKTTDGGLSWNRQSTAFPGAGRDPRLVHFFDADNGIAVGNPEEGYWDIYRTTDGGDLWERVPSENIPAIMNGESHGGGTVASMGNSVWFNTPFCSVYMTDDMGLTWSVSRDIFVTGSYGMEVSFGDSQIGMASSFFGNRYNKISVTSNGGISWTKLTTPPAFPSTYFISANPGTNGSYVVTSQKNIGYPETATAGSAYTVDNGQTWTVIDSLAHGQTIFVSTNVGWSAGCGDTIFKWDYNVGIEEDFPTSQLDKEVVLSQNYPNPFNSSTSILFRLQEKSSVILKIYDILGKEIATLVNEEKSPGTYKVGFNATGLHNGIYYYRLKAGDFDQTKTMVVLQATQF